MKRPAWTFASLLCAACASASSGPTDFGRPHRSFEFTYRAAIADVPAGARQVRMWVPLPESTPDQKVEHLEIRASHPYVVHDIQHGEGRSLCITSPGEPIDLTVTFAATRYESTGGGAATREELQSSLAPDAMIPLDANVARIAAALPAQGDTRSVARGLYDHTLARMNYDKPVGGGWGRGDSEWACDSGYGNCTDFHSYFIGLARAKGIPARFEMGFPIPGGDEEVAPVGGYHCWAEFWDDSGGWVPVDISEADKHADKSDYFFGTLDENRVMFTSGRDLLLTPRPAGGALNFFVYPHAEVDGVPFDGVAKSFSRRNL